MRLALSRRQTLSLGASGLTGTLLGRAAGAAPAPVLVELFTSQGCSSCPPADVVLDELRQRENVIAVSLNVDYWDYLGWKDTLAKPEFSKRQMDYASTRGDGEVYTPQMVIHGAAHAIGSRKANVEAAISQVAASDTAIRLSATKDEIAVEIGEAAVGWSGTLWIMSVAPEATVAVERGENAGRALTYHNVVRHLTPALMYKGKAVSLVLPRSTVSSKACKFCVAVLQEGMTGRVRGLALQELA